MKITVKSDIHLEFGPADAGKGDVLLLCGDICTAHDIKSSGPMQRRYLKFFEMSEATSSTEGFAHGKLTC